MAEEGGNTVTLLAARAIYKKVEGYLYLTDKPYRIVWVHPQTGEVPVALSTNDCTNLYANKSGAKPPKLKIVASDVDYNFIFAGEEPSCFVNRDAFRDQVKLLIRESMTQPSTATTSAEATPEVSTPSAMDIETPQESAQTPRTSSTPLPTIIDPAKELAARTYRLKKKILVRDPELAALHSAVVINGKMSDADFWASREHLIDEAAAIEGQKRGKSSRLIDPKPDVSQTGDIKISITPQLQMDIFEEWPIVKRAYDENVPDNVRPAILVDAHVLKSLVKMSKEEFWKRYFESQLYHNNRASVRSSATQHRVKEDPVFDKYLDPLDNEIEPRKARQELFSRSIDLVATREDHGETGNILDVTMQAGKQKSSLPLIRKFNEHSERLLNSALGEITSSRTIRPASTEKAVAFEEIDMEDLHGGESQAGIALDMQNLQRYFEGRSGTVGVGSTVDLKTALTHLKTQSGDWESKLRMVRPNGQAGAEAFGAITLAVSSRTKTKSTKLNVSPEFLKQMQTTQSTAGEYLRQFWFNMTPPPEGVTRIPVEERAKKIGAMRDRLLVLQKRIPDLVSQAAANRWDSTAVQEAFAPTLAAIEKAIRLVGGSS
ncbi:RNA polymerase II transcription factor B subunit 1 [Serendipita sp. 399]|nr:RNA polymerase II transcription factor B subunit 1 [Serendipita sp. 399]